MRRIIVAKTMEEAYKARRDSAGAVYLTGGTEVLRLGGRADAGSTIIDISSFVPADISLDRDKNLVIGAAATFQDVIDSPLTPEWLRKACRYMASLSLRMQATVGGNIASLRDDSYLIPTLLAAGARLKTYGNRGFMEGSLQDYVSNGGSRYAILSVTVDRNACVASRRIARSSSTHSALNIALGRGRGFYAALKGSGILQGIEAINACEPVDDLTGSAGYKRYIIGQCAGLLSQEVEE